MGDDLRAVQRVDLHLHSTASDGVCTPEEVVEAAVAGGLDLIALTDHDTTKGVPAALSRAGGLPIHVIPGVELSTAHGGRDVHLLAYFVDLDSKALRAHESRAHGGRLARMETMVFRLRNDGINVRMEDVVAIAGPRAGVLGRPHLARALVDAGYAASFGDAFDRFIGDGLPAFEPASLLDPVQGVELARASGGVAVWAHPPKDLLDALLPHLVRAGLKGLEVYRPYSRPEEVRRLASIARSSGLFATGGSDWHSPERGDALGAFAVPAEHLAGFLALSGVVEGSTTRRGVSSPEA